MKSAILPALFAALSLAARAAIVVPGADGSDGVLNITANTEIDLSQAVTGTWNQNNAANAGKGVYDPAKWAVVFKYSSVNVAAGATVTFKNHASRAPVVWLVNGNVTIAGTVSLDGETAGYNAPRLAEPGPGGFRGGAGAVSNVTNGAGFGIGGGSYRVPSQGSYGGGGGFGTPGVGGSSVYGNPSLMPLIGGSGGGGYNGDGRGGGGGGGAILIASSNAVVIGGAIRANGGSSGGGTGNGSGGAIRIVADSLEGGGGVSCIGGPSMPGVLVGGAGRVRLERVTNMNTVTVTPDPSVVPLSAGSTALIFPPSGAPEVRILSIGNVNAPTDPRATFGSEGADVALPETSSPQVIIETKNIEQASIVKVRGTPRANADATVVTATLQSVVSTDPLVIRWTATLPVNAGYSAVQAHVIRP